MPLTDALAKDLQAAVGGSEIFAAFQPQVSLESGSIVAAEALCRWRHPRHGEIDAATVIRLAERTGLIHALGRRMLDECLAAMAGWREAGRDWAVAVNVSPAQFEDDTFVGYVVEELTRRAARPGSLILELTRDLETVDVDAVVPQLRMLGESGVELSLSRPADPALLRRLPLTEVKLPGELVRGAAGPGLSSLTEEVQVAHAQGLRVVAEGIETLTHLDIAVQLGCDRAQGFLIRHPDAEIVFP